MGNNTCCRIVEERGRDLIRPIYYISSAGLDIQHSRRLNCRRAVVEALGGGACPYRQYYLQIPIADQ